MHSIRSEILKLRKRPMIWILIAIVVAMTALTPIMMFAMSRVGDRLPGAQAQRPEIWIEMGKALTLPAGLDMLLGTIGPILGLLFAIGAGVAVGNEYRWGTARASLARGRSRIDFVVAKAAAFVVAGFIAAFISFVVGIIVLVLLRMGSGGGIDLAFLTGSFAGRLAVYILRCTLAQMPYVLLAIFLAILTRSGAIAVGVTIVYLAILDGLAVQLLSLIGGFWADLAQYSIGRNVNALVKAGWDGSGMSAALEGNPMAKLVRYPPPNRAALILALYCLSMLGAALQVFRRRDLTSE
jgi:ABC-type transport system involved in multi-copper enzyme maturation permease subunit